MTGEAKIPAIPEYRGKQNFSALLMQFVYSLFFGTLGTLFNAAVIPLWVCSSVVTFT